MPPRTKLFRALPWDAGLITSVDESMIGPALTICDNVTIGLRPSKTKRDGINHDWDDQSDSSTSIIGLHDYWYGATTRSQLLIGVSTLTAVYKYSSSGGRTTLSDTGTGWSGTLTDVSMCTFNNLCIIATSGSGNVIKKYTGASDTLADLDGTPPEGSIVGEHLGRLWTNDKTNPDRLHYSPTHDHTLWNGAGDSGAIDIGIGDGDPSGITAFCSFQGQMLVWKQTRMYRVVGSTPETFQVIPVTKGLGCLSHNSVAVVDGRDVMWLSARGIHSLSATDKFGDLESGYISKDIQRTFNESLERSRFNRVKAGYLSTINSVAFAVTETSNTVDGQARVNTNTSTNNALYLYNVDQAKWYRWPDLSCESLCVSNDDARSSTSDKRRFYLGTRTTRVSKTFNGTNYDISSANVQQNIAMKLKTGLIFPEAEPYALAAAKRFIIYYRPQGTHRLNVSLSVDNQSVSSENQLTFDETSSSALLGTTFTLGSSVLGYDVVMGSYTRTVDGVGHGFRVTITQTGIDAPVEIQGFALEYEPCGQSAEAALRSAS